MRVAGLTSPPSADDYRCSCTQEYKELITVSPNSKRDSRMAMPQSAEKECTKGSLFSVQMTATSVSGNTCLVMGENDSGTDMPPSRRRQNAII